MIISKLLISLQGSVLGPLPFLIHISDINYKIADSTVSCFVNDIRILQEIKDKEDTEMLQKDLHKLYKWADTNNMKFNANKFKLLRYRKEHHEWPHKQCIGLAFQAARLVICSPACIAVCNTWSSGGTAKEDLYIEEHKPD